MTTHLNPSTQWILFDFDGTISDSHSAAIEIYNSMSEKFGLTRVFHEDLTLLKGLTTRELLKKLDIPMVKLPFFMREARRRFQSRIHSLHPFDGIPGALMELKEMGFRTGILTSNSQENVTQFLIANQLEQFDVIYSGASLFGKSKVIRSALKKQNLKTTDVLYVGDETRDIDAARSAGVRIVSVSWGFNNREILSAQMPDYLIDDPNQLSKICLQIGLNR